MGKRDCIQRMRFNRLRCSTSAPLGRPVDPEVKIVYATEPGSIGARRTSRADSRWMSGTRTGCPNASNVSANFA